MSAQDLEQRARELLAAEYEAAGESWAIWGILNSPHEQLINSLRLAIRALAAALRQQPAPVDLEQFREAVAALRDQFEAEAKSISKGNGSAWSLMQVRDWRDEADRLLSIINAGKLCPCGEATCTESWEPGCGLGESVEHAVPAEREPPRGDELRAILAHQPAPVVDDAAACRLDDYLSGEFSIRIGKQAARDALTAALARAQGVQP